MALTDLKIKNLKAGTKAYKAADRDGMYLYVSTTGSKSFRYNFLFNGKSQTITYGMYPIVKLAKARELHQVAKQLKADGVNPRLHQKQKKTELTNNQNDCFEHFATNWLRKREYDNLADATIKKDHMLVDLLLKDIGHIPIEEVTPQELIGCIQKQIDKGFKSWPYDLKSRAGHIFRYAIAQGKNCRNLAEDIKDALPAQPPAKNHAGITDKQALGKLYHDCLNYSGLPQTRIALCFIAHTFARPGAARMATWDQFNFDEKIWTTPAENMKGRITRRQEHVIPLSSQSIALLEDLKLHTGQRKFAFHGQPSGEKPISENTLNKALRSMGYTSNVHTSHGFRTTASTILNEIGYDDRWIERQMAHKIENKVKASYNKAEYSTQIRDMMQDWSTLIEKFSQEQTGR